MGHIELLEFYGLRLMVLLTLRDFDGIYQNHRSPYEGLGVRWFIWLIIPTKEDESNNTRLSLNFLLNYTTYSRIRLKMGKDSGIKFCSIPYMYNCCCLWVLWHLSLDLSKHNVLLTIVKYWYCPRCFTFYWIRTMEMFIYP